MASTFVLEGFEPMKRIGGGGFGDVWLTKQTNVDREVAVKVGHAPIQDDVIRLRFERECKALGRLSGHPNIVDVFTAGSLDDGRPYLVLEYIDGGTLWQRLKRSALSDDELINIGDQLAAALASAHSSGVLHRDLKPENILMRSNGDAVLGDFGIARLQDGANTTSAAITASVAYAAPEVLGGTQATVASDLYGIGVCLLAAILRSVPFVDKSDKSIHPIITRVMSEEPPDLRNKGVTEDLAKVVESLLHKDPSNRPASADDVQQMFQELRIQPWMAQQHLLASRSNPNLAEARFQLERSELERNENVANPLVVGRDGATGPQVTADNVPVEANQDKALRSRLAAKVGSRVDRTTQPRFSMPDVAPMADGHERSPFGTPSIDNGAAKVNTGRGRFKPTGNVKAFAIAYMATLAVGAVVIFLLARLLG